MPVTVQMLPNEAIVILTLEGRITTSELRLMFREYQHVTRDAEGAMYRITDVRFAEIHVAELMTMLDDAERQISGSQIDRQVRRAFVGSGDIMRLANDPMMRSVFTGEYMSVFTSLDEALKYARQRLTELT